MTTNAQADNDYEDIFDDANGYLEEPVEVRPDCADIFDVEEHPGETVHSDIADIFEDGDRLPPVDGEL